MPLTRTSWRKGRPRTGGRRQGTPNRISWSEKRRIKEVFDELARAQKALIYEAVVRGLAAEPPKSFPYLQLLAHYQDGPPAKGIRMEGTRQGLIQVILRKPLEDDPLAEAKPLELGGGADGRHATDSGSPAGLTRAVGCAEAEVTRVQGGEWRALP